MGKQEGGKKEEGRERVKERRKRGRKELYARNVSGIVTDRSAWNSKGRTLQAEKYFWPWSCVKFSLCSDQVESCT